MSIYKLVILNILFLTLYSCADYNVSNKKPKKEKTYFSSNGFVLVYENELYEKKIINKKISNEGLYAMHSYLKINTPIKIVNPENSKFVKTKIYKIANYPQIFNLVINNKIAEILELDENNPFVEIIEIKKNKTFIAKKSNTFDEEKNVAEKAPVEEIQMNELTIVENQDNKMKTSNKTKFFLKIGDFYYEESAKNLKAELLKKVETDKFFISKINKNSYRLALGPFKNFKALKSSYISLNNLGFDNLDIYKE